MLAYPLVSEPQAPEGLHLKSTNDWQKILKTGCVTWQCRDQGRSSQPAGV